MLLSINDAMNSLATKLKDYFDSKGYLWKSSDSLSRFEPAKPTIYKFCIPPTDINAHQMPAKCPAILIALTKWRNNNAMVQLELAINCVSVDPAIIDNEIAHQNQDGSYSLGSGDEYRQSADSLYRSSLLLAQGVIDAISLMSHTQNSPLIINVNEFEPPHPLLQDYPYAVCVVPAIMTIINNAAKDSSYENFL